MHQLILIIHHNYKVFDANPSLQLRGSFDLSKAFDRVRHEGLLKLYCLGNIQKIL